MTARHVCRDTAPGKKLAGKLRLYKWMDVTHDMAESPERDRTVHLYTSRKFPESQTEEDLKHHMDVESVRVVTGFDARSLSGKNFTRDTSDTATWIRVDYFLWISGPAN